MRKDIQILSWLIVLTVFCGCGTVSKTKLRLYSQDKSRVDQLQDGNAGYLVGTPKDGEGQPVKDTRRVYVVEFTTPAPEIPDVTKTIEEPGTTGVASATGEASKKTGTDLPTGAGSSVKPSPTTEIKIPDLNSVPPSPPVNPGVKSEGDVIVPTIVGDGTQYTVEKDDTLQKIAKKFYGSYGKWIKIYEANKDAIANPDILKPGITIRIPPTEKTQ